MNLPYSNFVIDVSAWQSLNELMLISDMLISDYSSIFFDFSILGRHMLTFCYDYEQYSQNRGMYFDIREELHTKEFDTQDNLLEEIKSGKWVCHKCYAEAFRETYVNECGRAPENAIEIIKNELNG